MKQNVGILDTAIRSILACFALAIGLENLFPMAINYSLMAVGVLLWISSSFGVCLLYKALGIDTYPHFSDDSRAY